MRKCVATGVAMLALALVGCSATQSLQMEAPRLNATSTRVQGTPAAAPNGPAACAHVTTTVHVLQPQTAHDPILSLPIPDGWVSSDDQNSQSVRGSLTAPGLRADDFTPNAVVTLADVTRRDGATDRALATEKDGLAQRATVDSETPGTLCGLPAKTFEYKLDGRQTSTLMVAAEDDHARVWVSTVTLQTTQPDNPDFVKAKQLILTGYQIVLNENQA